MNDLLPDIGDYVEFFRWQMTTGSSPRRFSFGDWMRGVVLQRTHHPQQGVNHEIWKILGDDGEIYVYTNEFPEIEIKVLQRRNVIERKKPSESC